MIIYINSDIFDQELDVIIHQANCFNKMKSGIAKEISKRYPEAVEADNRTKLGDRCKLGNFTIGIGSKDRLHIINLYSQYLFGRGKCHTDYDAMKKGLKRFIKEYKSLFNITNSPLKVGIPHGIGCGLGGGDWSIVENIIKELFSNRKEFNVYICKKG